MIYVLVTIKIRPGMAREMLAMAGPYIAQSRKEDGCEFFDLHQSISDPDKYIFIEQWASRESVGAHTASQHEATWRKVYRDCIIEHRVEIVTAADVEVL